MLTVIYKERTFLDRFCCIDHIKTQRVIEKAFTRGGLTYFKKDQFNYFVIDTDFIVSIKEI